MAYIEPPTQTYIIENFSENTTDNLRNLTKVLSGVVSTGGLSNPLSTRLGKVAKESLFDITDLGSGIIAISKGICLISGTYIETLEGLLMDINDISNYLFSDIGDTIPSSDGTHYIYLVMNYEPTQEDQDAYIGIMYDFDNIYDQVKDHAIILKVMEVTVSSSSIQTIDDILNSHPTESLPRVNYIESPTQIKILDGGSVTL